MMRTAPPDAGRFMVDVGRAGSRPGRPWFVRARATIIGRIPTPASTTFPRRRATVGPFPCISPGVPVPRTSGPEVFHPLIQFLRKDSTGERPTRRSLIGRLGDALRKTRSAIAGGIAQILGARTTIDDALLEDIEDILLTADVGVEATRRIIGSLESRVSRSEVGDTSALLAALEQDMYEILEPVERPLSIPATDGPFVMLVIGVNGAGKTTTIGKLAARLKSEGRSVMVAAGDTFRAAAIEQLQAWGVRAGVPVVAQHPGADSASVIYDAFEAARARGIDVLIADTAGRLHTRTGLMDELRKVRRVIGKLDEAAPRRCCSCWTPGPARTR